MEEDTGSQREEERREEGQWPNEQEEKKKRREVEMGFAGQVMGFPADMQTWGVHGSWVVVHGSWIMGKEREGKEGREGREGRRGGGWQQEEEEGRRCAGTIDRALTRYYCN